MDQAITLPATDVPYAIEPNAVIDFTAPLTLMAGVEFKFGANAGFGFYDNGKLTAHGTSGSRIRFTGSSQDPGHWRGIHLEGSGNSMSYAVVRHAGSNYVYCCNDKAGIYLRSGDLSIEKSNISDNVGCGILVRSDGSLSETNNTYSNNTEGDVCN